MPQPQSASSLATVSATGTAAGFSLVAGDAAPFVQQHYGAAFPAVIVCDHASNAVPRCLNSLGLSEQQLSQHIAWDLGAALLAHRLAQRLKLPLLLAGYSRLVIDCNRKLDTSASILAISDGQAIPGNADVSQSERSARAMAIFHPYHAAIDAALGIAASRVAAPALIAVHSFTPVMQGHRRPWHCGVLWNRDSRMAAALLDALRAQGDVQIGDNEPYSGRDPADYTVSVHAEGRGWPQACIEVRQDLLASAAGVEEWSLRLSVALQAILANMTLYEVAHR